MDKIIGCAGSNRSRSSYWTAPTTQAVINYIETQKQQIIKSGQTIDALLYEIQDM